MRLPELSNYACLPGKAGGSPIWTSRKLIALVLSINHSFISLFQTEIICPTFLDISCQIGSYHYFLVFLVVDKGNPTSELWAFLRDKSQPLNDCARGFLCQTNNQKI